MPSQYPQNVVTKNGLAMIAESVATRKNLIFTRVVVGDGDATGRNFNDMTSVISPKMELPVTSGVNEGNGQYLITATLSNNTLNVGFFPREVGLYAKVDGKAEMLYSYTNGGNNVGYVPDKTTPIDSEIYKIRTVIGNAKNITVNMSDSTFVTKGELDRYVSITSGGYFKDVNKTNAGMSFVKGDNTSKIIDFITSNYNDSDTNKVLNLSTLKSLLGQGAIVASKLDASAGFVKFANGFTIQWGITWFDSNRYYKDISLPISSTVLIALATDDSVSIETSGAKCFITWNSGFSQANRNTIRFLTDRADTGSFVWMAVGKD
nr:MAG TPA: tail-collar fiber protein [Bacteriophage sp.]